MYYIYHIKGKKIGVTRNVQKRVYEQQGVDVKDVEILETSKDIELVSRREIELQRQYGYEVDRYYYKQRVKPKKPKKEMQLNVTEATTTFPCSKNDLKGMLKNSIGMEIVTPRGKYILDSALAKWIDKESLTSAYRDNRCYVYNDALHKYVNSKSYSDRDRDDLWTNDDPELKTTETIFDKIREWAFDRGILKDGDLKTQYIKLQEEAGELAQAILKNDALEFSDAIGDMVVVLTNLAALEGARIEDCIEGAYNQIKKRSGKMVNGTFVKNTL